MFLFQIIKLFYAKVNLAKKESVTEFKDGRLYYVDPEGTDHAFIGEQVLDTTSNASRGTCIFIDGYNLSIILFLAYHAKLVGFMKILEC